MGKAYSPDLRDQIVNHIASGQSRRSASRHFGVRPSYAVKLAQRVAATGSAEPARQGRPPGDGKFAPHMATLHWCQNHRCPLASHRQHLRPMQPKRMLELPL